MTTPDVSYCELAAITEAHHARRDRERSDATLTVIATLVVALLAILAFGGAA